MRGKNRGVTPDRGPEGVPIKGPAKDAKEVEGRGDRKRNSSLASLARAPPSPAHSLLAPPAKSQPAVAKEGKEGEEEEEEEDVTAAASRFQRRATTILPFIDADGNRRWRGTGK